MHKTLENKIQTVIYMKQQKYIKINTVLTVDENDSSNDSFGLVNTCMCFSPCNPANEVVVHIYIFGRTKNNIMTAIRYYSLVFVLLHQLTYLLMHHLLTVTVTVTVMELEINQLNVKNAFLYCDLEETMFIVQSLRFIENANPNYVCHLILNALYGLE